MNLNAYNNYDSLHYLLLDMLICLDEMRWS
jgi:hypothetical protein